MANNISTISTTTTKQQKYRNASAGMTTVAMKHQDKYQKASNWNNALTSVGSGLAGAGTAMAEATDGWSLIATGIGVGLSAVSNWIFGDKMAEEQRKVTEANQAMQNILSYGSELYDRDTYLQKGMQSIETAKGQMSTAYGKEFTNLAYNAFLAKSGVTPETYSMLTGNFKTFDQIGYGKISDENGLFDELTKDDANLFNNVYKSIETKDFKSIITELTQSLYGSETATGMQLRAYESQISTLIEASLNAQTNLLMDAKGNLLTNNINLERENVAFAQEIGKAEAGVASSGLRGGTTTNNVKIAELEKALNTLSRMAQTSILIRGLQYSLYKEQQNTASSVFTYKLNQKLLKQQVLENTVNNLNSIGMTAQEVERQANANIENAKEYEKQVTGYLKNADRSDYETIVNAL